MTSPHRPPRVGDVFAVRTPSAADVFGRIVSTSAIVGPIHDCQLVYVYRPRSRRTLADLLTAPMLTSRAPWSRRYFEIVASEPLLPGDFLERHGFRGRAGALYDEESRPIDRAPEPIGEWRLHEDVATIEAAIREGLARSP